MDDNAPKENPPADFNKLDLSQLQGFSFGTQWTQDKATPGERRERIDSGDRPRRDGGGAPFARDRRSFRRPSGPGSEGETAGPGPGAAPGGGERREYSGDRRPRPGGGGGDYRGGPGGGGGPRYDRGGRGGPQDRGPYESPYYSVTFYPEDTSFNTLVQTIRKSCRTVELFEIARTVVDKTDRFVVVIGHKTSPAPEPAKPAGSEPAAAAAPAKERPAFYIALPDGMPFESDDSAVAHVLSKHLDKFFDTADVEVEPPKGNFQVINKCGVTGELLGPPNYHRYNQIVQQHHAAKLPRMSFEAFKSRIETIRDPEVVNQWLAKMKKATRYTLKPAGPAKGGAGDKAAAEKSAASEKSPPTEHSVASEKPAAAAEAQSAAAPSGDAVNPSANAEPAAALAPSAPATETPATGTPAVETPAPAAPAAETPATPAPAAPAAPTALTFDTLEDARMYLLTQARDKVVRTVENARVHGTVAEQLPPGEIRRAIEGALERQRRFPLDTANALRGRLRREHFTIFKKGSKGVSYVCAVKRKFRVPGQVFADSIGALISFIEANPMIRASELPGKFLSLTLPPAPKPAEAATSSKTESGAEAATPAAPAAAPEPMLSIDDRARISRMQGDLMWLVREGYVTEFIDGRLFAAPPMVEARKKEVESEEHDPENFPEIPADAPASESAEPPPSAPAAAEAAAAEPETAPVESSPSEMAPGEASSAEASPAEASPAEVHPSETPPVAVPPASE